MPERIILEIFDENPIAGEIVKDWLIKDVKKSETYNTASDELKRVMISDDVINHTMVMMYEEMPGIFMTILDENGIFVSIIVGAPKEGRPLPEFVAWINHDAVPETFGSRIKCEKYAVEKALLLLK